ncbi:MAG: sigma-70 family RNA polymerase sigma factor [Anaerohalosphaera sp.]|nr:sigma-70 family RNA polymerase sigma factor [Anaerohalosphaera sp.]
MSNNSGKPSTSKEEEFFELFIRHQKHFYSYILALVHDFVDADDILQDIATVMWRKFDEFEEGSNFQAWGIAITRYTIMSFFSSRKRSRLQFDSDLLDTISEATSKNLDSSSERLIALRHCHSKLSNENQSLIQMRYRERMNVRSIAESIGRTENAIYKIMGRLHNALLRCIEQVIAAGEV